MKSIMYHYVRNFNPELPFFNFLSKKSFKNQIEFFNKNKILKYEKQFENNSAEIVLTFDDDFKDHIYVAEELKKKKVTGIFFISAYPLMEDKFLDVHKAHLINGKVGGEEALKALNDYLKKNKILNFIDKGEEKKFKHKYSKNVDTNEKKEFKKIINYYGSIKLKTKILDELMLKFKINIKPKEFYMSSDEIKYLSDMGMIIGSHAVSHNLLSRLNEDEQRNEIKNSKELIEDIIKKRCNFFCFPYGGEDSYNSLTLKILKEFNYSYSFTVQSRDFDKEDLKTIPLELPRFDCIEFK